MKSVNDIMPMIGARFYTQLDAAQVKCDVLEGELAKVRRGVTRGAFTLLRHLFMKSIVQSEFFARDKKTNIKPQAKLNWLPGSNSQILIR